MSLMNAEQQAKALARSAVPVFLFGLLLFIEGLIAPFNEPARAVIAWVKLLPVAMAIYIQHKGQIPNIFGQFKDDYAQKTMMLASSRAGTMAMLFVVVTLFVAQGNPPWIYQNAADMIIGVYLMTLGAKGWWEMREDPEPEQAPDNDEQP
jgi:hypothetical protein